MHEKIKKWIKPELLIVCESETDENLLGSGGACYDQQGNPIPC